MPLLPAPGSQGAAGRWGGLGGDDPTCHRFAWQNPGSRLASLSSTREKLLKGGERSENGVWGKPGPTGNGAWAAGKPRGKQSHGRTGDSPCPAAPIAPPAALLLKPMLCFIFLPFNQRNHKTGLQGKKGRGEWGTVYHLKAACCWPQLAAERSPGLGQGQEGVTAAGRHPARFGVSRQDGVSSPGTAWLPEPASLPQPQHPHPVPPRCRSHGHGRTRDTLALD